MSFDWTLADTGLVPRVVPGNRPTKMGFRDRFSHGFECSTEHLVNEKWDAGNLSHQVTSQLIKLFVAYCDEINFPVEAVSSRIAHISVLDAIAIALSAKKLEETTLRSEKVHKLVNTIRR